MSKLSKFKSLLTMAEAARLLSDLIGEKVDKDHLLSLYEAGWIRLFRPCHGELIKLKPALDSELFEMHASDGRYFMESEHVAGVCLGLHLPCDTAYISAHACYALRDAEGGLYAIRDSQTDEYLSPFDDFDEDNTKVLAVTADIYTVARQANTDSMPEKPTIEIMVNDHCIAIEQVIYNFAPNEIPHLPSPTSATNNETIPPSLRITVAALLEAATSGRKTHTQDSLIESILERNKGIRGLSESSLKKHFADSNNALSSVRKVSQD